MDEMRRDLGTAHQQGAADLTVEVRGPDASGGRVDAAVYVRFLADFLRCVRRVERRVRREGEKPTTFQIADMRTSSPTVRLHAVTAVADQASRVVSAYIQTVQDLEQQGSHPAYVDVPTLHSFRKLAGYIGDGLSSIVLSGNQLTVTVTKRLERAVGKLLGMVIKTQGSFSGRLDYVNAHNTRKCRIYPSIGPTYVECAFDAELLPEVARGLKQQVTVAGTLYYYGFQPFPHRIDAEEIVVHPPGDQLPTIWDLWGMAPDVIGDARVEDYVRGLREADE